MYADQAALLETGARRDLIHQMQGKIANERPYIVLNYQNVIEAHSTQVGRLRAVADGVAQPAVQADPDRGAPDRLSRQATGKAAACAAPTTSSSAPASPW